MLVANRNMVFRGETVRVGDEFKFELTDVQRQRLIDDGYVGEVIEPSAFVEVNVENEVEELDPEKGVKRAKK